MMIMPICGYIKIFSFILMLVINFDDETRVFNYVFSLYILDFCNCLLGMMSNLRDAAKKCIKIIVSNRNFLCIALLVATKKKH